MSCIIIGDFNKKNGIGGKEYYDFFYNIINLKFGDTKYISKSSNKNDCFICVLNKKFYISAIVKYGIPLITSSHYPITVTLTETDVNENTVENISTRSSAIEQKTHRGANNLTTHNVMKCDDYKKLYLCSKNDYMKLLFS